MKIEEACAQFLRRHRDVRGLSQHALAYEAGINRNNVSLYETAERMPSISTLFLLASAFKVAPDRLVAEIAVLKPKV